MKQQKFSIKEEPFDASDESNFKNFYNFTNSNAANNTTHGSVNTKSFNLRKINANRVYLNSLLDKNVHNIPRVDEKLEAEKKTHNKLNSEKVKFLQILKLKPIKEQINANNVYIVKSTSNQSPQVDKYSSSKCFEESTLSALNTDTSLIDQLIKTKVSHVQSTEFTDEKSKIDIDLEKKSGKPSIASINFDDLKFKVLDNSQSQSVTCAYDYLFKIGGNSVPFECFQHVIFQLKHVKFTNNTTWSLSFNPATSSLKSNEVAAVATNENTSIQLPQQNSKFEFIYEENFYWVVKIRKIFKNLFQLKFMRSTSTTSNNENNGGKKNFFCLKNSFLRYHFFMEISSILNSVFKK